MIKTIVLDLGGVYFTNGTQLFLNKIQRLIKTPKTKLLDLFESRSNKEGFLYRKGQLTKKQFWDVVIKKLNISPKMIPKIQEMWHASYKPQKGMPKLITKLSKNYRLIVFSGNIKERIDYLEKKYHFKKNFDYFLLSYKQGLSKSENKFYELLLTKINCKPEECLYVDDKSHYLDLAKKKGIKTLQFTNLTQFKSDLKRLKLQF